MAGVSRYLSARSVHPGCFRTCRPSRRSSLARSPFTLSQSPRSSMSLLARLHRSRPSPRAPPGTTATASYRPPVPKLAQTPARGCPLKTLGSLTFK